MRLREPPPAGGAVCLSSNGSGVGSLHEALADVGSAEIVNRRSHVDPPGRRVLFRSAAAVLANCVHERFGLVGLETMAVDGIACTGCSGEDYAVPGQNVLILETQDPHDFLSLFRPVRHQPCEDSNLREAAEWTA